MDDKPVVVSRDVLHRGFARLERVVFRRPRHRDGVVDELTREILDAGDGVAILPFDCERGVVALVRQFRGVAFLHDKRVSLVEVCAGKLEGSDPAERVVKEVEEETGIVLAAEPQPVFTGYSSPGSFTERLTFFVAPYVATDRRARGGGLAAEGEDVEVLEMPLDEAIAMIGTGAICDTKTIALLFYAKAVDLLGQAASNSISSAAKSTS